MAALYDGRNTNADMRIKPADVEPDFWSYWWMAQTSKLKI